MILFIDNYDSFTYNLVQIMQAMGQEVQVFRNDQVTLEHIERLRPCGMVISPGPGSPDKAGISVEAVRRFGGRFSVLGVCLGHQAVATAYGGRVVRAEKIMHGKTSRIFHDQKTIYQNLSNPFEATRYHSLIVERESLPDCLEISAWTEDGEIMGIRHSEYDVEGVQFHPESILTVQGVIILQSFLEKGGKDHD